MEILFNVARKKVAFSLDAANILNVIISRTSCQVPQRQQKKRNKFIINPIFKAISGALAFSFLTILTPPVFTGNIAINVTADPKFDNQNPAFSPDGKKTGSESEIAGKLDIGMADSPESSSSQSWNEVNDFVYQLQDMDLTAIGDTKFDLVITDYSLDGSEQNRFTADQITLLKKSPGGPKLVLAYMSIGEAENYRWYWNDSWDADNDGLPDKEAPSWLGPSNPDWQGNYKVKYWEPGWRSIIYGSSTSYLDKIIETGFDGVYLDVVDAYEYWGPGGESGLDRETAEQEMVDFVIAISEYARYKDSDFGVFPQNGAPLGEHNTYLDAVTGIGQEDIYYGYNSDGRKTPKKVTKELEGYLDAFKNAGKLVLTIDYPFSCSEDKPCFNEKTTKKIDKAYKKSEKNGYVPYCTVRNLNYLTINPGHQPD